VGRAQCEEYLVGLLLDIDRHAAESHGVVLLGQLQKCRASVLGGRGRRNAERGDRAANETILHGAERRTRARLIDLGHATIVARRSGAHHGANRK
jgi:hypothetical protein